VEEGLKLEDMFDNVFVVVDSAETSFGITIMNI
jgi:hypothetical protein